MDLFDRDPQAQDAFAVQLAGLDVELPLRLCDELVGVILDASGKEVLTVDELGERDDAEADAIAKLIIAAVNVAGGFGPGVSNG